MSGAPAIAELEDGVAFDLPPDVTARIESLASGFVAGLVSAPIGSPAFGRAIRAIDGLGEREVAATTRSPPGSRTGRSAGSRMCSTSTPLSRHVRELEKMAGAMSARLAARGSPDGDADDLDDEDRRAAERVRELIPELDADRALLETDNAAVAQQEQALWREIETLRQYAALAARLDQLMADHVEGLQAADPARAHAMRVDVLYAIRRRRRDLLLQLGGRDPGLLRPAPHRAGQPRGHLGAQKGDDHDRDSPPRRGARRPRDVNRPAVGRSRPTVVRSRASVRP